MSDPHIHEAITTDGVTVRGAVHGQGPPLVFVHGSQGDGDLGWQPLLPHLTGRFTAHLPGRRGRGLTEDHPDHTLGRMVDDLIAYVDSVEVAPGVVGWSAGATSPMPSSSAGSRRPCWCCTDRPPGPSSAPPPGTSPTTSRTRGSRPSPAPGTPPR